MIGTCKFCGQSMMTEEIDEEIANEIATEECKCEEGRRYRNIEDMKREAKNNVESLFESVHEPVRVIMNNAVDAIAAGACKTVTIKVNERIKAVVAQGKDSIKVSRIYNETSMIEAECL